jgi:subtilisin-like proprotein convertase family protein
MRKLYPPEKVSLETEKRSALWLLTPFLFAVFFSGSLVHAQTSKVPGPHDRTCDKKAILADESYAKELLASQADADAKHKALVAEMKARRDQGAGFARACSPGNIIVDGGFETTNGTTFINPSWPATSTNFGTSFCNAAACGTGGGTAGPRTGTFWSWFGGTGAAEAASAQQSVIFPTGAVSVTLNYYLWIGSVTAPFNATFKVLVDGVQQTSFTEPAVAETGYTLRTLNLTSFADGLPHIIRFEYDNPAGSGNSNFSVDDVSLDVVCASCTGVPSPGFITGPAATVCSGSPATLTLNSFTSGGGITYQWKSSATPGGPYTNIAGATNTTYNFTSNTTTYFVCTVTCVGSGFSATTSEFTLNVTKPVHSAVSATPSTTCSPGSSVITGTVSGGNVAAGVGIVGTSGTINLAIPDNNTTGVTTPPITLPAINIPNFGSLRVRLNIFHSFIGDLIVRLNSPCGNSFIMSRIGGTQAFGTDGTGTVAALYTFDPNAASAPPLSGSTGSVLPAGSYKPTDAAQTAHNWTGITFPCTATGGWTLTISDNAGLDIGTLVDWAILAPTTGNYTHALTGPGTIVQNPSTGPNNSTANFTVSALPAGTHNFTLTSTDMAGCTVSSPLTVTVNQTPAVTITPSAPVICAGAIQQLTAGSLPGTAQTFTSTTSVTVPGTGTGVSTGAPANPYPSVINVTGLPAGAVVRSVTINGIVHTFPADIDIVLQSPTGTNVILMSDAGGTSAFASPGRNYTLSDAAPTLIASGSPSGTYRPTNIGTPDSWPAPGPGSLTQAAPALSSFTGSMNGAWNLYVVDDAGGDVGTISGWAITFDAPAPVVFSPVTNLFTDAAATIAYTAGTPVSTVWAKPPVTTTYTATGTNAGCTNTANAVITVNQLPAITVQPAALAAPVCPGFNVTYSVTATGTGLTYQWQLSTDNGTTYANLAGNPPYSGVTTNTLLITNVSTAMTNFRYRCVVSGTCPPAATSSAVTLVVATTPTITTPPANLTVCANANASFTVVTGGIPAASIFQWQVSTDAGATWTNLTTGGSFTPTFTITGAGTALSGNRYRVIVTNNCGQTVTSAAATLTVNAIPVVTVTSLANTRICLSDTLLPLVGSPAGGSWSGAGVSGFNFVPGVTAVGTYTLTYSFTNTAGCTAVATTVAKVEDCPERQRLLSNDAVILYPNPNNGQFFIKMNSTLYNYLGVRVYNMTGQVVNGNIVNEAVSSPTYNGLVYGRVIPIDLTRVPSGTYLVKVYYDDGVRTSEKGFLVVTGK